MRKNSGFTLIELLVVIAIIGLLSTVVMTSLNSARKKGRDTRRVEDIASIRQALEVYYDENGAYPSALSALASGGQMSVVPNDPQSNSAYSYAVDSSSNPQDYVLRATLETAHKALNNDIDGTVYSVDCGSSSSDTQYCVQP